MTAIELISVLVGGVFFIVISVRTLRRLSKLYVPGCCERVRVCFVAWTMHRLASLTLFARIPYVCPVHCRFRRSVRFPRYLADECACCGFGADRCHRVLCPQCPRCLFPTFATKMGCCFSDNVRVVARFVVLWRCCCVALLRCSCPCCALMLSLLLGVVDSGVVHFGSSKLCFLCTDCTCCCEQRRSRGHSKRCA